MITILTPLGIEIEVGQRWEEVDPRFERVIEITMILHGGYVRLKTVGSSGRETQANINRFNGKRGGYKLAANQ